MQAVTPEEHFRRLLLARNTLLWINTVEERRVERRLATQAHRQGFRAVFWDCATGATDLEGNEVEMDGPVGLPSTLFDRIRARKGRELWILRDFSSDLEEPTIRRGLKSLARDLQDVEDHNLLAAVVVLESDAPIPRSLAGSVVAYDWPLPDAKELASVLASMCKANGLELGQHDQDAVIDAASGLAADDFAAALSMSLTALGKLDAKEILRQKKMIIDKESTLTWVEPDERGMDAIGGLELLKDWLEERRLALSPEARAYGLAAPKGLFLAGVPGCGKSATARAVPAAWGLPLIRLDLGALRGSLVGQSEANIRRALRIAEAVAPCVLWVDEIEKSLAGSGGRGDGGVAADQLGTILTWQSERTVPVFVVATANSVQEIMQQSPELLRQGRFDAVFFVDLPSLEERKAVLRATLAKHGRSPETFDLDAVAERTADFSGAELAELVPSGLFRSFRDGARELTTADLIEAASKVTPLAASASEKIDSLRQWARGRARPASVAAPARRQINGGGAADAYARAILPAT